MYPIEMGRIQREPSRDIRTDKDTGKTTKTNIEGEMYGGSTFRQRRKVRGG